MHRLALIVGLGMVAASGEDGPAARAASFPKDGKGGVDLSSYAGMKKGGKGGAVFVEGAPDKSSLVTSISGDKPDMPKKAAPLTKAQVMLISAWVKEGAKNN